MFTTLAEGGINIEMISQGASEINISCGACFFLFVLPPPFFAGVDFVLNTHSHQPIGLCQGAQPCPSELSLHPSRSIEKMRQSLLILVLLFCFLNLSILCSRICAKDKQTNKQTNKKDGRGCHDRANFLNALAHEKCM